MSEHSIRIRINPSDVNFLKENHYFLYVFKGIIASSMGVVTIWDIILPESITSSILISWKETYYAYNSVSSISSGSEVYPGNRIKVQCGNIVNINTYGNLSTRRGPKNQIGFINAARQLYTIGLLQQVQSQNESVSCAFNILGGGAGKVFVPVNKIALIFSTKKLAINTVVTRAMSAGILIDMDSPPRTQRTVKFSTDKGWTENQRTWVELFKAFEDLSEIMISADHFLVVNGTPT